MNKRLLIDPKEIDYDLKKLPPNSRLLVYIVVETEDGTVVVTRKGNRFTLNKLGTILLGLQKDFNSFKNETDLKLDMMQNENRQRFDKLEDRLDYIVKANKLKDKKD